MTLKQVLFKIKILGSLAVNIADIINIILFKFGCRKIVSFNFQQFYFLFSIGFLVDIIIFQVNVTFLFIFSE